jgi:ERF superfamily
MQTSEQINELATALAKAQGAMGGALKDSANPFFKSKYADLESVWNACRKALSENGLSVIQTTSAAEHGVAITTMLAHSSGQWIRDTLALQPKDMAPQGMGSAITYGRRYALAAIVGVYQTDDDGEAAHGRRNSVAAAVAEVSGTGDEEESAYGEMADRMRHALEVGIDQPIYELHQELNRRKEFYIAVSALLSAPQRRMWKEALNRCKSPTPTGRA